MNEMHRVWKNPGFWLSVILSIFSMLYPHMDTHVFWETPLAYFASADFLYFMLMPLRFGLGKLLLPFMAVFPAATFLAEDQKNRYHLMLYYRYGPWEYMRQRMKLAVGAAILATEAGVLIYTLFVAIVCPWHDNIIMSWRNLQGYLFNNWINCYEGIPFIGLQLVCLGFSSAIWGLVGFSISCLTKNNGITIGGTFLCHYTISWLCSHKSWLISWSPMVLQSPSIYYNETILSIILRLIIWLVMTILLSIYCASRFIARLRRI